MSRFWPVALCAGLGLFPLAASAQEPHNDSGEEELSEPAPGEGTEPKPQPAPTEPPDEDGPEPPLVLPAPDALTGHLQLSPLAGVAVPFGSLEADLPQSDAMSSGWAFGLDASYGVSRTLAVGAFGQFLALGKPDSCGDCKTKSMAVGAFVRYHLVQGFRFDPWMLAGLGYRTTTISGVGDDVTYSGIEWLRLAVGGDWYAFDKVGFGPYLELDMGYYSSRSSGDMGSARAHWHLSSGLRVTLDLPGK